MYFSLFDTLLSAGKRHFCIFTFLQEPHTIQIVSALAPEVRALDVRAPLQLLWGTLVQV